MASECLTSISQILLEHISELSIMGSAAIAGNHLGTDVVRSVLIFVEEVPYAKCGARQGHRLPDVSGL